MEYVLLMAGSITHAQRMAAILENRGIRSALARAPEGTDPRGCGYGVRLRRSELQAAQDILRHTGIKVRAIYEKTGDSWREVVL